MQGAISLRNDHSWGTDTRCWDPECSASDCFSGLQLLLSPSLAEVVLGVIENAFCDFEVLLGFLMLFSFGLAGVLSELSATSLMEGSLS